MLKRLADPLIGLLTPKLIVLRLWTTARIGILRLQIGFIMRGIPIRA